MPNIKVKNIDFNYELIGDNQKPPLVLISGYTSDCKAWDAITKKLANNFYILIFDNQGIGKTIDQDQPLNLEEMAKNTKALMGTLNIKNPIIAGFAMGSAIAQNIARLYPDYASQLVLLSSTMKWSETAKEICEKLYTFREKSDFQQYANTIYDTCFSEAYKVNHSKEKWVEDLSEFFKTSQTPKGQKRQLEALKAFDSTNWAHEIEVPTIVISPELDPFSTPEESKKLANAVKNVKCIIIPGCGHAILDEVPDFLVKTILTECVKKPGNTQQEQKRFIL